MITSNVIIIKIFLINIFFSMRVIYSLNSCITIYLIIFLWKFFCNIFIDYRLVTYLNLQTCLLIKPPFQYSYIYKSKSPFFPNFSSNFTCTLKLSLSSKSMYQYLCCYCSPSHCLHLYHSYCIHIICLTWSL